MTKEMLIALGTVLCAAFLTVPAVAANEKSAAEAQKTTVILKDASGVPFDIVVSRSTRIMSGNRELKLNDLVPDTNRKASVRFVPERSGDVAQSIRIGS
jgi:hypothetical protein